MLLLKTRAPAAKASIEEQKSTPIQLPPRKLDQGERFALARAQVPRKQKAIERASWTEVQPKKLNVTQPKKLNVTQRIALTGSEVTVGTIFALFDKEEKELTFASAVDMIVGLQKSTTKNTGSVASVLNDSRFAVLCDVVADTVAAEGTPSTISLVLWSLSMLGVKYGSGMRVLESLARAGTKVMPDTNVGLIANILWSVSRMSDKGSKLECMRFPGATESEHEAFTKLVLAAAKAHVRDTVRPRKFRDLLMTAVSLASVTGYEIPDQVRFCMRDIARECSASQEEVDISSLSKVLTAFTSMKVLSESESTLLQPLLKRMLSCGFNEGITAKEASIVASECAMRQIRGDARTCETMAATFAKTNFDQWGAVSLQWLAANMDFKNTAPETVNAMVVAMVREMKQGRGVVKHVVEFTYLLSRNDWVTTQRNVYKLLGDFYVETDKEFQAINHTIMAWAMARASIYDEKVFCKVVSGLRGQLPALSSYGLSNVTWAFGRLSNHYHNDFFQELLEEATTRVPEFTRLEMRSVLVGALMKKCVPRAFLDAVKEQRQSLYSPQWWEELDSLIGRLECRVVS